MTSTRPFPEYNILLAADDTDDFLQVVFRFKLRQKGCKVKRFYIPSELRKIPEESIIITPAVAKSKLMPLWEEESRRYSVLLMHLVYEEYEPREFPGKVLDLTSRLRSREGGVVMVPL